MKTVPLTETQLAVRPYLAHVEVQRGPGCTCPATSWAPCGGQYEGRYDAACPLHRVLVHPKRQHSPSCCPKG